MSRNCLQNSVGLPALHEDLFALGNYLGYCGTRSLLLNSLTNYWLNCVSVEFIPGRWGGGGKGELFKASLQF